MPRVPRVVAKSPLARIDYIFYMYYYLMLNCHLLEQYPTLQTRNITVSFMLE